jgi:chemotaxis signal transduction protein
MSDLAIRADDLRRAFDGQFAVARAPERAALEDLLAIRIGEDRYAIRLAGITGLFADRPVTPLPTLVTELLGIAGFRGTPTPVYDLRLLLGYSTVSTVGTGVPRWLVLVPVPIPGPVPVAVGLAFDHFDRHLQLPSTALVAGDQTEADRRHIRGIAQTPDGILPIIHIPSLLDAITRRSGSGFPPPRSDKL